MNFGYVPLFLHKSWWNLYPNPVGEPIHILKDKKFKHLKPFGNHNINLISQLCRKYVTPPRLVQVLWILVCNFRFQFIHVHAKTFLNDLVMLHYYRIAENIHSFVSWSTLFYQVWFFNMISTFCSALCFICLRNYTASKKGCNSATYM